MIEMTRLRLINWHNFQDNCIPFRMVTYLIGVNAVGKTTIMDAIRYCLTTNKDFNAAGNRKSTRTLQGSVHGKQRGENIYLRPGHTVSYVGVEFMDHERDTTFVISVRVESESGGSPPCFPGLVYYKARHTAGGPAVCGPKPAAIQKGGLQGLRSWDACPCKSKGCQKAYLPYSGDR